VMMLGSPAPRRAQHHHGLADRPRWPQAHGRRRAPWWSREIAGCGTDDVDCGGTRGAARAYFV